MIMWVVIALVALVAVLALFRGSEYNQIDELERRADSYVNSALSRFSDCNATSITCSERVFGELELMLIKKKLEDKNYKVETSHILNFHVGQRVLRLKISKPNHVEPPSTVWTDPYGVIRPVQHVMHTGYGMPCAPMDSVVYKHRHAHIIDPIVNKKPATNKKAPKR